MDILPNPVEAARRAAGVSLAGLSNATGIPRTSLRRKLEHPQDFTVGELFAVCKAVGVDHVQVAAKLAA